MMSKMSAKRIIMAGAILAICSVGFSSAYADIIIIADAAGDWVASDGETAASVEGGTAAGWSYLYSDAASGGTETSMVQSQNTGDVGGPGYAASDGTGRQLLAIVGDNANDGDYELFSNGNANSPVVGTDILMHPDTRVPIVRYTFSADDISVAAGNPFSIEGSFRNQVSDWPADSVSVFVYHNTTQLFTANGNTTTDGGVTRLMQADGTFAIGNLFVNAGDTISFAVDPNGSLGADETALQATITTIPEPVSASLLALAALAIGLLRRRLWGRK